MHQVGLGRSEVKSTGTTRFRRRVAGTKFTPAPGDLASGAESRRGS
jgi:hypothetical protein